MSFGADELNLAEFPLAILARRHSPSQKTLEFEDEVYDEGAGKSVRRRLVISGSDRFGLPTPVEIDVLLVLIQLTKQRTNFSVRSLNFSRYELLERLRWNHGGSSYRRIDEALQRWASTTLYYHQAWWDRPGRRWRSRTFHVIESLDLKGVDHDAPDESPCSLSWNEGLFESFQASNLKALNLDTYFALKRPAARQAYRFLDKRFYHSARLEFDLRVFACEHVGLSREHNLAQLKRTLEPIFAELESIEFLESTPLQSRYLSRGRGDCRVVLFRRKERTAIVEPEGSLAGELILRGVWNDVAAELAESIPEPDVRRYIALHDWLVKRNDKRIAKNSAGFLAACIANRLPFPRDFDQDRTSAEQPKERKGRTRSRPEVGQEQAAIERDESRRELALLSDSDRQKLEAAAIQTARPLVAATYERLRSNGGKMFEEIRDAIVIEYLTQRRTRTVDEQTGGVADSE